jgi:hypothetical protein
VPPSPATPSQLRSRIKTGRVLLTRATYVDEIFVVSNEQVPEYSGLVQIPQPDHVFDAVYGRRMHGLDPPVRGEPVLLAVVVPDGDPAPFGRDHLRPDGHIELVARDGLDPDVVALQKAISLNCHRHNGGTHERPPGSTSPAAIPFRYTTGVDILIWPFHQFRSLFTIEMNRWAGALRADFAKRTSAGQPLWKKRGTANFKREHREER